MDYEINLLKEDDIDEYKNLLYQLNNYKEDILYSNPCIQKNIYILKIDDKIVCTAKLLIEHKLYEPVGHIEDVVTHSEYRNKGLGKYLIQYLLDVGIKEKGCYKVILSCKDDLCNFYTKCGLIRSGSAFTFYKKS